MLLQTLYLRVDENGQGIKGGKVMNYPALSKMLLDARMNLQACKLEKR